MDPLKQEFEIWYLQLNADFDQNDLASTRENREYFFTATNALWLQYREISERRGQYEAMFQKMADAGGKLVAQETKIALLKELCHRAYSDSDIRLKDGWIADYKRLVEEL